MTRLLPYVPIFPIDISTLIIGLTSFTDMWREVDDAPTRGKFRVLATGTSFTSSSDGKVKVLLAGGNSDSAVDMLDVESGQWLDANSPILTPFNTQM